MVLDFEEMQIGTIAKNKMENKLLHNWIACDLKSREYNYVFGLLVIYHNGSCLTTNIGVLMKIEKWY